VKSQPGVGLGLFLVQQLARALGGNVEARNAREGGSGFEVELRLPLALEA
jgi:C4-dicarboxylate-specific signal transduction histidine kinase